jgi:hypothetical protein
VGSSSRQRAKQIIVWERRGKLGDLSIEAIDCSQCRAQLLDQNLDPENSNALRY